MKKEWAVDKDVQWSIMVGLCDQSQWALKHMMSSVTDCDWSVIPVVVCGPRS